jgi:hypothetical protein
MIHDYIDEQNSEQNALNKGTRMGALAKACFDPFDYALKLRTGEVIRFESASLINSEWIHISIGDLPQIDSLPYKAERGIDIQISEIVWVMDAPMGS